MAERRPRPLDGEDRVAAGREAEIGDAASPRVVGETVEVGVQEDRRTARRPVFVDEGKGRRRDLQRVEPKPLGEAPDEDGLPAPEVAEDENRVARPETAGELPAELPR